MFSFSPMLFFGKTYVLGYLLESPRRGDSNKYTKRMIYKRTVQKIRYSCFRWVHIKFLYNSIFDFTAESLVPDTVVITRVLCILFDFPNSRPYYVAIEISLPPLPSVFYYNICILVYLLILQRSFGHNL